MGGGGGHSPWPSGREASPEDSSKQGSRRTEHLFTWEPDTPRCESSFMDRLQPADYSAAAWVSPREATAFTRKPAHAQVASFPREICPGPLPVPTAKRSQADLCLGRWGLLAELLQVGDLLLIPSPFSLHLSDFSCVF